MKYLATLTPSDMHNINCTAVLELIRREGPIFRSNIAVKLNLTLPSILRIIDNLINENLIRYVEMADQKSGRKRPLVALDIQKNITIGLDLGGYRIYGAVVDFGGNILFDKAVLKNGAVGDAIYDLAKNLGFELLEYANKRDAIIRGMGVGVPGVTQPENGNVKWAPSLKWKDYPLRGRLRQDFNLPVMIENDVNLSALGESWFGIGKDYSDLAFIRVGTGIGMGLILNGSLYRGTRDMAGEIRHMPLHIGEMKNAAWEPSSIEHYIAGIGISEQAREALGAEAFGIAPDTINAEYVFQAYENAEPWAIPIIDGLCDHLAMAIVTANAFFDPGVIVLGGSVAQNLRPFLGRIGKRMKGKLLAEPNIYISDIGPKSSVLGAMINIMHNTKNYFTVKPLS